MARQHRGSNVSHSSSNQSHDGGQELESMYDYLAKIVLIGPSGSGKSCLLYRFLTDEWRALSSHTIGVELASKTLSIGTGRRRQRIKLQLWDTAGTERFRAVSRSYYRGAAGAVLVYDVSDYKSFAGLPTFLSDARALASPNLAVVCVGNKCDLAEASEGGGQPETDGEDGHDGWQEHSSTRGGSAGQITSSSSRRGTSSTSSNANLGLDGRQSATIAPQGREVSPTTASRWASQNTVPAVLEASAVNGDGVDEVFTKLASIILTKIELGEINPDDPQSGIQYGDAGWRNFDPDAQSLGSSGTGSTADGNEIEMRRRKGNTKGGGGGGAGGAWSGIRESEEVFRLDGRTGKRRGRCC